MINKGKIIFVNGYWNGIIGGIIGSDVPGKKYWGTDDDKFEKAAERFLGISERANTHLYIDASSVLGGDSDGADRFNKGAADLQMFDDAYFKRYAENADKQGIHAGLNFRKIEQQNQVIKSKYSNLTLGMDKGRHVFYIITHSEGGGYGAGLAKFLIKDGWKVDTVIHLSTDEAQDFNTPPQPMTYQLGLEYNKSGDWLTGNYQIRSGVDKWGIANDPSKLDWGNVHGYSKNEGVFKYLEDLRTVAIGMYTDQGKTVWKQIPGTTVNNTKFSLVNGIRLKYT